MSTNEAFRPNFQKEVSSRNYKSMQPPNGPLVWPNAKGHFEKAAKSEKAPITTALVVGQWLFITAEVFPSHRWPN
jgi:hypothetical protein